MKNANLFIRSEYLSTELSTVENEYGQKTFVYMIKSDHVTVFLSHNKISCNTSAIDRYVLTLYIRCLIRGRLIGF